MQSVKEMIPAIEQGGQVLVEALKSGGKILLCGNGGSAADAQHIAAEIVGRFEIERMGLPAIALTTDTSILTSVGNDYGYERLFSRQIEALAQSADVLIAYSTSGNSENVLRAVTLAREKGCKVIVLSGRDGGKLSALADVDLCVSSNVTARIQEAHAFIGHVLCSAVDEAFPVA
jgi:D-sedoheptulose 7-phosphate isomerase